MNGYQNVHLSKRLKVKCATTENTVKSLTYEHTSSFLFKKRQVSTWLVTELM